MRDPYALAPDEMMTPARAPAVPELVTPEVVGRTLPPRHPMNEKAPQEPNYGDAELAAERLLHRPDRATTPPTRERVAQLNYPKMAETEARAGVAGIEELQAERAALVALNSRVKALKDSNLWKELRDIELAKASARARAAWAGEKAPSEAYITSVATADPAYVQWIEQLAANFSAFEVVEERITEINELVNRGQALLRYASSEPKA